MVIYGFVVASFPSRCSKLEERISSIFWKTVSPKKSTNMRQLTRFRASCVC